MTQQIQARINNFFEECKHEEITKAHKALLANRRRAKRALYKDRKNKGEKGKVKE